MSCCCAHVFGIVVGHTFSSNWAMTDVKQRIMKAAAKFAGDAKRDVPILSEAISSELFSTKGSVITIAGVFNYFGNEAGAEFAKALSVEFNSTVLHVALDESTDAASAEICEPGLQLYPASFIRLRAGVD